MRQAAFVGLALPRCSTRLSSCCTFEPAQLADLRDLVGGKQLQRVLARGRDAPAQLGLARRVAADARITTAGVFSSTS
jgi:hypothetical protein